MIWNEQFETMPTNELRKFQLQNLKELVLRVYNRVPFYKEQMDKKGIKPSDIKSLEDIQKLPFITKTDMRDVYPYGLLATDMSEIVEIHASSGTTGKPVVDAYTQKILKSGLRLWPEHCQWVIPPKAILFTMLMAMGFSLVVLGFTMEPEKSVQRLFPSLVVIPKDSYR